MIQGPEIHGNFTDGRGFQTYAPNDPSLIQRLYGKGVSITARAQQNDVPWFVSLLLSWLPFIALIGVWIFLSRQMQGAGGKALGFGKSRAKLLTEAHGRVTFEDVAGVDEPKQDLQEIVQFLKEAGEVSTPRRQGAARRAPGRTARHRQDAPGSRRGGRSRRPVLLDQRLGLRRDVRRRGRSRVRDLFEQAKANAPCIIFIDEIDAVGRPAAPARRRHDEREQTFNQLWSRWTGSSERSGDRARRDQPAGCARSGVAHAGRFDRRRSSSRPSRSSRPLSRSSRCTSERSVPRRPSTSSASPRALRGSRAPT